MQAMRNSCTAIAAQYEKPVTLEECETLPDHFRMLKSRMAAGLHV